MGELIEAKEEEEEGRWSKAREEVLLKELTLEDESFRIKNRESEGL